MAARFRASKRVAAANLNSQWLAAIQELTVANHVQRFPGWLTAIEIAEQLKMNRSTMREKLRWLRKVGKVDIQRDWRMGRSWRRVVVYKLK